MTPLEQGTQTRAIPAQCDCRARTAPSLWRRAARDGMIPRRIGESQPRIRRPGRIRVTRLRLILIGPYWPPCSAPPGRRTYPARPIRLVTPFPPAGSLDIVGRAIVNRLSAAVGQPVVLENRPGAGGVIGSDFVRRARPTVIRCCSHRPARIPSPPPCRRNSPTTRCGISRRSSRSPPAAPRC